MIKIAEYLKQSDKTLPYNAVIDILKHNVGKQFIHDNNLPQLTLEHIKNFSKDDKGYLIYNKDSYFMEMQFKDGDIATFFIPSDLALKYKNYVNQRAMLNNYKFKDRTEHPVKPSEKKYPYILVQDRGQGVVVLENIAKKLVNVKKLTKDEYFHFQFWGYRQEGNKYFALFEIIED